MVERPSTLRERQQLGDVAAAYIRDQITSGTWLPGDRVKPDVIANHLGISSTPVREALQTLRSEGLIDLVPRRGFTVSENQPVTPAPPALPANPISGLPVQQEPQQLGDEAASYIRNQITSGNWAPGTRVRPELIASQMGISTTPVREALHALRTEGFLILLPRRGFAVARITGDDIRDMFVAQAFIAGELASRAATRITSEGLKRLEDVHASLTESANRGDLEALGYWNQEFHKEVDVSSESPRLAWVLGLISRYSPQRFYADIEGWPQTTIDDHAGLVEAIRRHDARAAREEMADHIRRAGEQLAQHVDDRLAGATGGESASPRPPEIVPNMNAEAQAL